MRRSKRIEKLAKDIILYKLKYDGNEPILYDNDGVSQIELDDMYNNIFNNTGVEEASLYAMLEAGWGCTSREYKDINKLIARLNAIHFNGEI